jgi:hypothetical protein
LKCELKKKKTKNLRKVQMVNELFFENKKPFGIKNCDINWSEHDKEINNKQKTFK